MRHAIVLALSTFALFTLAMSAPAHAARVEDVVAACDKMDAATPGSCNYEVDDKGLHGCTSGGTCFNCPADGKRQCYAAASRQGKPKKWTLGEVQLSPKRGMSEYKFK